MHLIALCRDLPETALVYGLKGAARLGLVLVLVEASFCHEKILVCAEGVTGGPPVTEVSGATVTRETRQMLERRLDAGRNLILRVACRRGNADRRRSPKVCVSAWRWQETESECCVSASGRWQKTESKGHASALYGAVRSRQKVLHCRH